MNSTNNTIGAIELTTPGDVELGKENTTDTQIRGEFSDDNLDQSVVLPRAQQQLSSLPQEMNNNYNDSNLTSFNNISNTNRNYNNRKHGNDSIYHNNNNNNNNNGVSQSQQNNSKVDDNYINQQLANNRKVGAEPAAPSAGTHIPWWKRSTEWQDSLEDYVPLDEKGFVIVNDIIGEQMIDNYMEPFGNVRNVNNYNRYHGLIPSSTVDDNNYHDFYHHGNYNYKEEFKLAATDIATYNSNPKRVYNTLKAVTKKLYKDDPKYRTLDTTNPKVIERLIGFEGVLDFLRLLGFESDLVGAKLICTEKPQHEVLDVALDVLKEYSRKFDSKKKPIPNYTNLQQDDDTYDRNKQLS